MVGFRAALVGIVGVASLVGCFPGPRGPIDLRDAEVKEVRFQLKHPRSAICPGEPVPLDVSMDVNMGGEKVTVRQHRDEMDEPIFSLDDLHLESPQGSFVDGSFIPNADARSSITSGFVFYARAPRGPAFAIRFPPYYECGGKIGGAGIEGFSGRSYTEPGRDNRNGMSATIIGAPKNDTLEAIAGGPGPRLSVYVTWVRTADYTKILAARSEGDIDMLTLVAPGYPLNVVALGGRGGDGGKGSKGGFGGASGGQGGNGGAGGVGGEVEVLVDERYPELEQLVNVDVRGGQGGEYGAGGSGGDREWQRQRRRKGQSGDWVIVGEPGKPGIPGTLGKRGEDGHFTIKVANIQPAFKGVAGLTVL